ncbi:MAG: ABC transporter ATP-binding protein [Ethanoligenens sp.]
MAEEALIQIQHLSKKYQPTVWKKGKRANTQDMPYVLKDVNLAIPEGEFHIFLGWSGCGKSTLLNILAGFLQKTEGSVQVNQKEVTRPGRERGVVFQNADAAIFPWLTVWENVEYGLKMQKVDIQKRKTTVQNCIGLVGLEGHEQKYPAELSGGMKQRVQIARSLANDSQILILDEPFGALDAQTRKIMQNELIHVWQQTQKTILFVTHDIQEAVYLGQKISVFSRAPDATIFRTIDLPYPYRRNMDVPELSAITKEIEGYFDVDYAI